MSESVDEAGWDVEPGDEIEPVVQAVGRLLKVCREAAELTVAELAGALGYSEDLIRKIERGRSNTTFRAMRAANARSTRSSVSAGCRISNSDRAYSGVCNRPWRL